MRRIAFVFAFASLLLTALAVNALRPRAIEAAQQSISRPSARTFLVDGVERHALLYLNSTPAPRSGAPLVFVFHGHGGTAQVMANRLPVHELWPEAVVIYMQGIPGVVGITDATGTQNGWQKNPDKSAIVM